MRRGTPRRPARLGRSRVDRAGFPRLGLVDHPGHLPRDGQEKPHLSGIRTQSASMHTPIPDAFDAVLSTPTVTRDPIVTF